MTAFSKLASVQIKTTLREPAVALFMVAAFGPLSAPARFFRWERTLVRAFDRSTAP